MKLPALIAGIVLALLIAAGQAQANLREPSPDAREGVLDASRVVIVTHTMGDSYQVERAFLGSAKRGDIIVVPRVSLYLWHGFDLPKAAPTTADTRILMFLYFSHGYIDQPDCWAVTHYGRCLFWERDPSQTENLVNIAQAAVTLRKAWESARDIPDKRKRVAALWPYLDMRTYGLSFFQHTEQDLQETKSVAGDYIASTFGTMTKEQRMMLLPTFGLYGGDKLHHVLRQFLHDNQTQYDAWLAKRSPSADVTTIDWEHMPPDIRGLTGYLDYSQAGLFSFHDRSDLPYIGSLAVWAASHGFRGMDGYTLDMFRVRPNPADIPVIATIWEAYLKYPVRSEAPNPSGFIEAYSGGNYIVAIPYLTPFLSNSQAEVVRDAHRALVRITGKDLGGDPTEWLSWYKQHQPIHH